MGASTLSSRAIIGEYYRLLKAGDASWIGDISMLFGTDQEQEILRWLGTTPAFRKWAGPRIAKGISEHGVTIAVEEYEATLEFLRKEVLRDKTGQIMARIREFAVRSNQHWAKLLTNLIIGAEGGLAEPYPNGVCYDGQLFFDTDHAEGDSGIQSNDLAVTATKGEAPTVAQFRDYTLAAVKAILSFKDDQGEPMNEGAGRFLVMVPVGLWDIATVALRQSIILDSGAAVDNILKAGNLSFDLVANGRLDGINNWYADGHSKWGVFRTDGQLKPFIRLEEGGVEMAALAEGSEFAFHHRKHLYGAAATRGCGYGYWQDSCLVHCTDAA